jgi:hypothetical protein
MHTICSNAISRDTLHINIISNKCDSLQESLLTTRYKTHATPYQIKNLIFSLHLFEFGFVEDFTPFINESLNYLSESNYFSNLENVYILYNTSTVDLSEINSKFNVTKIYLNYFLMRSYFTTRYCKNFKLNKWKPNNKQALFLIGDPLRVNRLPILHTFAANHSLDYLNYTLDYNYLDRYKNIEDYVQNNIRNISYFSKLMFRGNITRYTNFLLEHKRIMDFGTQEAMNMTVFNRSAYIIPDDWFNASLILCMESYFYDVNSSLGIPDNDRNILSEKFWKNVLSKKPFITSSYNDHYYEKIEKLGFKTFLNYTSCPKKLVTDVMNYSINDVNTFTKYTNTAYKRITSFLDNMNCNKDAIENDVEYNYELWKQLAINEWDKLLSNCPPLKEIDKETINYLFLMNGDDKISED